MMTILRPAPPHRGIHVQILAREISPILITVPTGFMRQVIIIKVIINWLIEHPVPMPFLWS